MRILCRVTRKDRQEVAFHSKQKYEERETGWSRGGDEWVETGGCRSRGQRGKRIDVDSEKEWKEKKIKQIGMQHTTTGGWNEGGVKLGQLGVPASGERVGSILSLSLSLVSSYTPARTRERARRHAGAYMHALPPVVVLLCFSYFPSFPPSSVVSTQQPVANPETH